MAQLSDGTLSLPFSGETPLSRHASAEGAKAALPRAGTQAWTVYLAIRQGPKTDHELVTVTGLPLNIINARRRWLVTRGLIAAVALVPGPHGVPNTRWGVR